MGTVNSNLMQQYQQPLWGRMDPALRNCMRVSAALGVAVLVAVFVAPALPPRPTTVDDMPERIARLILEKPRPATPPGRLREQISRAETPPQPAKPKPPPTRRRTTKPRVTENKGTQGRQKAQQEVTQNLAQVTGSLDKVMENLSKSLPASENSGESKPQSHRRRGVRSGRGSHQLSSVQDVPGVSSANISGSAIESEGISISAITDLTMDDAAGGGPASAGTSGTGPAGRNDYRSNESLLSVVRRYAPGIQYCYDNELKKNPGLRGKLVVSLTVLANGRVSEAFVVENTLGSSAVTQCVLSQIHGWQFPEIPHGSTSFRTPFVFTPPE